MTTATSSSVIQTAAAGEVDEVDAGASLDRRLELLTRSIAASLASISRASLGCSRRGMVARRAAR